MSVHFETAGSNPAVANLRVEPFFRWRDDWCLGVRTMDEDHRSLAELIDRLASDMLYPAAQLRPYSMLRRLAALDGEARRDFAREEDLMRQSDYPALAEHKCEHDLLLAEFTALVREVMAGGAGHLDIATLDALKAWFLGHLLDTDKRFARWLREVGFETPH